MDKATALKLKASCYKSNPIVKIHTTPFQFWMP